MEELLEYLEYKWLNIENQQVAFISTILRVYKAEVLGYMRDFVDQQRKDSPSLMAIYSGGSSAWRNLEKRIRCADSAPRKEAYGGFLSTTLQFYNVDALGGGSFYDL